MQASAGAVHANTESWTIEYNPNVIAAGEMVFFVDKPAVSCPDSTVGAMFLSNYETVSAAQYVPCSDSCFNMRVQMKTSAKLCCRQTKFQNMTGHLKLTPSGLTTQARELRCLYQQMQRNAVTIAAAMLTSIWCEYSKTSISSK